MSITHVKGPLPGPRGKTLLKLWRRYEADVVGFHGGLPFQQNPAGMCGCREAGQTDRGGVVGAVVLDCEARGATGRC